MGAGRAVPTYFTETCERKLQRAIMTRAAASNSPPRVVIVRPSVRRPAGLAGVQSKQRILFTFLRPNKLRGLFRTTRGAFVLVSRL